ncbi:MAG TPA: Ppx/GppA phosphatase family protein [Jatrophihabitantaceae bacterium]|nr:Ppx/GppA phosphatase family protein [Jatrophihabitantaceae bacterium]
MRVAAIDCGTNSVRLLVSDDGVDVHRETRIVRLGQDVDRTGLFAPEAIERTRVALTDYAAIIERLGVQRTRMVATSATRDARNRSDFTAVVHATLGVEPEVVTGDEEAALSFAGSVGTLPGLTGPLLLVDLGGGSTELVVGSPDGPGGLRVRSMDVGSVRMTERHLHDDPPTVAQVEAVVSDVTAALNRARRDVPLHEAHTIVGVAGTITTIAAIVLGLERYDSAAIHGARLSARQIAEVADRLTQMSHAERAAMTVIHPGRVDVIAAGAIVLRTIVQHTGTEMIIACEHDILDGIARSIA